MCVLHCKCTESGFLKCSWQLLLSQNAELLEEARTARIYKDDLDVFREKVRHFLATNSCFGRVRYRSRFHLKQFVKLLTANYSNIIFNFFKLVA